MNCLLNVVVSTTLWDTGAQVSIVSHDWVFKNLSETELCNVESLLGVIASWIRDATIEELFCCLSLVVLEEAP